MKIIKLTSIISNPLFLTSCGDAFKYRKVDAKEYPADPKLRIKKNMEEGRGFRLMDLNNNNGTNTILQAQILCGEQP
jgi:hypothetical protein